MFNWIFPSLYVTSIQYQSSKILETSDSVNKPFVTRKLLYRASNSNSTAPTKKHDTLLFAYSAEMYFSNEFNEIFVRVLVFFLHPMGSKLPDEQQDYTVVFVFPL